MHDLYLNVYSLHVNQLLTVVVKKDDKFSKGMRGLHEDLHAVLHVLGIADLCHITHPLYPDLVRQVLATAEFTFKRPGFPIFEEVYFTFFASGVKHSITLEALTEVMSNLLFTKDQTSKVTRGELQMLSSRIKPPYVRGEPEDYTVPPTYPWPREEGTEISITYPNIPKSSETRWDKEASRRYNTLLNTNILPTPDLCHITHALYPDLVRQVLATAEFTFKRPGFPIFEEAYFTFFASGVKHSITLEALTEVYEMSEEYTQTSFPRKFVPEQALWKFIASGDFKS
ncbi:hypothetical protein F2Q68_00027574 [Brassica cretica]|uniref:Uncharacterized protein n=1 Tax=Brassica cretica TaxID=69181 RepID=A0A8S9I764_BRACR|nr:hypothetical protein F2Q68_00027574 [Brassica cretica]